MTEPAAGSSSIMFGGSRPSRPLPSYHHVYSDGNPSFFFAKLCFNIFHPFLFFSFLFFWPFSLISFFEKSRVGPKFKVGWVTPIQQVFFFCLCLISD